ncbi:hypothetical protein CAEBREN_25879 [Caenorhabditis brenneri]|uniref:SXP/RAL-2 family protein Ani s 5-like cation-binding domain-containing protein n=1 Tax=Caenorhabditis brenneri TaxID=135651 RepID=G0NMS9_CAEBE|nr:hypothetical protein CAEBREN_25879 [Caenorhabditis brenneri]
MYSSKVAFALVASIALASAVPIIGDTGLGGILGENGQGGVGGVTGGEGDLLGGLLGGILGGGNGGLLGGILGNGGIGNLLDLLGNPELTELLQPLLGEVLTLVQNLLSNVEQVLAKLSTTLEGIISIISNGAPLEQQSQALKNLRAEDSVSFDTIFYIVDQLQKEGGNGGIVPPVSLPTPISVPTLATPQIPV